MIRIVSKKAGFRRCGVSHPDTPVEYPNERFTEEELERLKAEPMLFVQVLPDSEKPGEPEAGAGKTEKTGKKG
jgi:hypothetical protein